jgi:hypothetical protein
MQHNTRTAQGLRHVWLALFLLFSTEMVAQNPVWTTNRYRIYPDRVEQDSFTAKAVSRTVIHSDYQSPVNQFKSSVVDFKFSINGKDNEMLSGMDHHFNINPASDYSETPLIKFGTQLNLDNASQPGFLQPGTKFRIRLDMRHVLKEMESRGFYTCFNGSRIYKDDFKAVYVAGSSAPLIWDFDNLVHHPELQLQDQDGDGIFEIELEMNKAEQEKRTASDWKISKNLSAFPSVESPWLLSDALYNMALEEMINAVEPDSTLRTGKEWAGVWTRDVSYSIILAMAHLQPQAAKYSLLRKVDKNKKIIQDTGTGGAWPVSTDRMIWVVAAWELFKVTGDKAWLREAYEVVRHSLYQDWPVVYDSATGLVKGESSFLDWREQTYPEWMQPADIFSSFNLGTNAVYYQAHKLAAQMAAMLGDDQSADWFSKNAGNLKNAINQKFWLPQKQYYAQYLYGRNYLLTSPRSEALGTSLCILFGIADDNRARQIVRNMPQTDFGITCIYPQIPGIPPYHNNGIWPFVQAFWLWAGAEAGNEVSVMESIAAIYRPAALFLTNKENFVAENGDFAGTQINSSNMLWSLSGNISIVHRVLFGMQFESDQIRFKPFVPKIISGKRVLRNVRYRNAILDITVEGHGNRVLEFSIDGQVMPEAAFPANLSGRHRIHIRLQQDEGKMQAINKQAMAFSPATPQVSTQANGLSWQPVSGAAFYELWKNGKRMDSTLATQSSWNENFAGEWSIIAVDSNGNPSFASEPLMMGGRSWEIEFESELPASNKPYKGFSGSGFVESNTRLNHEISVKLSIEEEGQYAIRIRYANGNGPVNTENKCAVRGLRLNGQSVGTLVFPQRGKEEWSEWGWSNSIRVSLTKGEHLINIVYEDKYENMHIDINQAMLDKLELLKLGESRENRSYTAINQ